MFNVDDFLNSSNEAVLDTKVILHPEGEFKGSIGTEDNSIKIKPGESTDKTGNLRPWANFSVVLETEDITGEIEQKLFRKPRMTYSFFLDIDDAGKLDVSKQKNIRLGALMAAAGLKSPWRPTDLKGKRISYKVAHVKSDMNPGEKRAEVVAVGIAI